MILLVYDMETFTFSDTWNAGSVPLSVARVRPWSSWAAAIGCCRGPGALGGRGANDGTRVVFCKVSDWLRWQPSPKLLHSFPQCCSHWPRSRPPTHRLTSSPHFTRKFISSTYGLEGTHTQSRSCDLEKTEQFDGEKESCMSHGELKKSKTCWMLAGVPVSPWGKHQMELDQAAHGVHVVLQRQAELVFGVALSLERVNHLSHSGAPSAHAAEPLPQSQRHAPQSVLHRRLTLGGAGGGGGGGRGSVRGPYGARSETCTHFCSLLEPQHQPMCPSTLDRLWTYITLSCTSVLEKQTNCSLWL